MERAQVLMTVADRITTVMRERGIDTDTLADAADIDGSVLRERLLGESDFTWPELAHVGGVLSCNPAHFMAGAA